MKKLISSFSEFTTKTIKETLDQLETSESGLNKKKLEKDLVNY